MRLAVSVWTVGGLIAVLLLVISWVYKYCLFMGFHVVVYNNQPGPCRLVPNIEHGSEDIEMLPGGNKALITSGLRFWERANKNFAGVRSKVFLFDFDDHRLGALPVQVRGFEGLQDSDFHGLSIYLDQNTGDVMVYIVNHGPADNTGGSFVEMFVYNDKDMSLNHLETFGKGDNNFGLLNDVTAVGHRQFYVTNTLYSRSKAEMLAQLKWSPVTFYDGRSSHVAAKHRLLLGNGIAQSPDGKYIYVAHSWERELIIYTRQQDNMLEVHQKVPLYVVPDNIYVDNDSGDLFIGCSPKAAEALASLENPAVRRSSSKVLRIQTVAGSVTDITEVFSDTGRLISGSSVAVFRKNQLLIGTVASKSLICDVRYVK